MKVAILKLEVALSLEGWQAASTQWELPGGLQAPEDTRQRSWTGSRTQDPV